MTPKRVLLAILCLLFILIFILFGLLIDRFSGLINVFFGTSGTTSTTAGTSSSNPSTPASGTSSSGTNGSGSSSSTSTVGGTVSSDHEHVYELLAQIDPTCTTNGSYTYQCSCGQFKVETAPAFGHNYGYGQIDPPTCTEVGHTTYTCTVCGYSDVTDEVAALGHKWDEGTQIPATCTADACTEYHCTNEGCEEVMQSDIQEGTATDHVFGEWGMNEDGEYVRICENCGLEEQSQGLMITGFSGPSSVTDVYGNVCNLYEIYAGNESNPQTFRFLIYDYSRSTDLFYQLDPANGLLVTYESGGDLILVRLPLNPESVLYINTDGTYSIS